MPPHDPEASQRKFGPTFLLILLGIVFALFAAVFLLHPRPPGAIDTRTSPAFMKK